MGIASDVTLWAFGNRRLMRAPIPLFRAGLGFLAAGRFVMVEHRGRRTGLPRQVVVEVVAREPGAIRVMSGKGRRAQWFRNISADPHVRLWFGTHRGVPAVARVLTPAEAAETFADVRRRYGRLWPWLEGVLGRFAGAGGPVDQEIPVVELTFG
ncbi:MAG: nitroreductase family deazaflavin-dependent oxidoreductase [Marmoricola sp.]